MMIRNMGRPYSYRITNNKRISKADDDDDTNHQKKKARTGYGTTVMIITGGDNNNVLSEAHLREKEDLSLFTYIRGPTYCAYSLGPELLQRPPAWWRRLNNESKKERKKWK